MLNVLNKVKLTFSLSSWKMWFHYFLAFIIYDEKSTVIQIVIPLYVICHFPLAAFMIFSFSLVSRGFYHHADWNLLIWALAELFESISLCLSPNFVSHLPEFLQIFFLPHSLSLLLFLRLKLTLYWIFKYYFTDP